MGWDGMGADGKELDELVLLGAASLDAGGGEGVHADLADVLRLQLHGYVLRIRCQTQSLGPRSPG